jgi:hypothetical protein
MRRIVVAALAAGLLAACGRVDEGANRVIVGELPVLDHVELLDEEYYGFCSTGELCPLGNDRNAALLTYSVDTEAYTPTTLIDAYRSALAGWEASVDEICATRSSEACGDAVVASFTRGTARIDLNLDNWPVGRFELTVDARGAPEPSVPSPRPGAVSD